MRKTIDTIITAYEKIIMDIFFIQEDVFYSCTSVVVVIIIVTTITEVFYVRRLFKKDEG